LTPSALKAQEIGAIGSMATLPSDYSQVEFNVHRPALQDKRVRQALIYGLDRQKLIDFFACAGS
jgi:ABC-type oligopeptide transport system substrate-binding subunit